VSSTSGKKVGVYVPVFNNRATIADCLRALAGQSLEADEILVIDDGSTDGFEELVQPGVRVVPLGGNHGLGTARNKAVEESSCEILAALDADCIADREWLEALVRELGETAPLGVVGVGGRVVEPDPPTPADRWRSVFMKQHWGGSRCVPPYLFGSNTCFFREEIIASGGYDAGLKTNYEDVDLCRRVKKRGLLYYYTPEAVVYHWKRDTVSSVLQAYWRWQMPPKERRGRFSSVPGLIEQLHYNQSYASQDLLKALAAGDGELVRITGLVFFSHCLLDIRAFLERSGTRAKSSRPGDGGLRRLRLLRDGLLGMISGRTALASPVGSIEGDLAHTVFPEELASKADAIDWEEFGRYAKALSEAAETMCDRFNETMNKQRLPREKEPWARSA